MIRSTVGLVLAVAAVLLYRIALILHSAADALAVEQDDRSD